MSFIAESGEIHGDIKPSNILVSQRDGRLSAFVSDFGITGKSGGTPIFMSPEGLNENNRIIEKTDIYSFAVTVLFLVCTVDVALKMLFIPISRNLQGFHESLSSCSLLQQISKSLLNDPERRINLDSWIHFLRTIKNSDKDFIEKIDSENLEDSGLDLSFLNKAIEKEGHLYFFILDFFGYDVRSSFINKNSACNMSEGEIANLSLSSTTIRSVPGLLSKSKF